MALKKQKKVQCLYLTKAIPYGQISSFLQILWYAIHNDTIDVCNEYFKNLVTIDHSLYYNIENGAIEVVKSLTNWGLKLGQCNK